MPVYWHEFVSFESVPRHAILKMFQIVYNPFMEVI